MTNAPKIICCLFDFELIICTGHFTTTHCLKNNDNTFFNKVLRQKDQLLSRMLISCPVSEEFDPVLQNEHIQNEKRHIPLWDKGKKTLLKGNCYSN